MSVFRKLMTWRPRDLQVPAGATVHGHLEGDGSGRIDGCVEGDVKVPGRLITGPDAVISGNVYAGELIHYGQILGHVNCAGKSTFKNRSFVQGNLTSKLIEIEEGAFLYGQLGNDSAPGLAIDPSEVSGAGKNPGEADLPGKFNESPETWF